ncbi:hypothetical protein YOLOSWAG_268 [Erwinia phage vB_EamM_Yoloswag]|uniref:Uncharacterized protein n=1 Tax=Erwinia phage vB_EamM_Yoloswag TaxID=1958956 RepID=A0A1S6L3H5_9CAUD|nr:hypothetical protein HOR66_gp268 [Erwinia phage vB_EamM_Yoloswag]AQT28741.1 hypothetical protein YOLOSWAG_268 [Erwinia phage vB_EamM_Yoloswag]
MPKRTEEDAAFRLHCFKFREYLESVPDRVLLEIRALPIAQMCKTRNADDVRAVLKGLTQAGMLFLINSSVNHRYCTTFDLSEVVYSEQELAQHSLLRSFIENAESLYDCEKEVADETIPPRLRA